jgi:hypothetical protein
MDQIFRQTGDGQTPTSMVYHPSCNFPGLLQQDFKELLAW